LKVVDVDQAGFIDGEFAANDLADLAFQQFTDLSSLSDITVMVVFANVY